MGLVLQDPSSKSKSRTSRVETFCKYRSKIRSLQTAREILYHIHRRNIGKGGKAAKKAQIAPSRSSLGSFRAGDYRVLPTDL